MPAYFRIIQAVEGVYDFTLPNRTVEAAPPGAVVRGHTLVWCENNPEWLLEADLDADALEAILVEHVHTVVGHYQERFPEQVVAWDVVNEPLSWQGPGCLWNKIGIERGEGDPAYVRLALRAAREADPDAALYLNDFAIEAAGERADRMVTLVQELQSEGVPLDGVGLQSHFALGEDGPLLPPAQMTEMIAMMSRFADLGLELAITEADVALPIDGVTENSLNQQAAVYGEVVQACLAPREAPNDEQRLGGKAHFQVSTRDRASSASRCSRGNRDRRRSRSSERPVCEAPLALGTRAHLRCSLRCRLAPHSPSP